MIRPVGRLCLALSLAALLAGGVLPVIAAVPAPEPASKESVQYLEKRLEEMKAEQRDTESIFLREIEQADKSAKEYIDKSVATVQQRYSDMVGWLGIYAALLGVIVALLGFVGWRQISAKVADAEKEIKGETEKVKADMGAERVWIDRKRREIEELLLRAQDGTRSIEELLEKAKEPFFSSEGAGIVMLDEKERRQVEQELKFLQDKPQPLWTAEEWFLHALSAGMQKEPYTEIAAYDELIERFNKSTDNNDLTYVAMALTSKGTSLLQLDRPEEAMACYEKAAKYSDKVDLKALPKLMEKARKGISFAKGAAKENPDA